MCATFVGMQAVQHLNRILLILAYNVPIWFFAGFLVGLLTWWISSEATMAIWLKTLRLDCKPLVMVGEVGMADPLKSVEYGALYDRLARQNALVRLTHFVMSAIVALVYESQRDLSHYGFWRSSGWALIAMLGIPLWPYAVSCKVAWRRATADWLKAWIFCFVLVAITLIVCLWYLSESSRKSGLTVSFIVTLFQAAAFYAVAEWTFEDSVDDF